MQWDDNDDYKHEKKIIVMETFHFQFNLNYNYKSHYYKVISNWLAWFYKKKL